MQQPYCDTKDEKKLSPPTTRSPVVLAQCWFPQKWSLLQSLCVCTYAQTATKCWQYLSVLQLNAVRGVCGCIISTVWWEHTSAAAEATGNFVLQMAPLACCRQLCCNSVSILTRILAQFETKWQNPWILKFGVLFLLLHNLHIIHQRWKRKSKLVC